MSITPRHTHRRMVKFARLVGDLELTLPRAIHLARVEELARLDDRPTSEGGRTKGHISDPTGETATKILEAGREVSIDADEILDTIGLSLRMLSRLVHQHTGVDLHDEAHPIEHRRCGQYTPRSIKLMAWYSTPNQRGRVPAECTDDAMYDVRNDGSIGYPDHGLCPTDYRALRRASIDIGELDRGAEWVA